MNFQSCPHPSLRKKRNANNWFVAQLKPGGFTLAKRNLERQGFETFMPMRERTVRHARQNKRVQHPIFGGYLFVRFNPDTTPWRAINGTQGVSRLITISSNMPQKAPNALMSALISRCDPNDLIIAPERLEPGDRVTLLEGPFKDIVATVESCSNETRVRILIDLLGRGTYLECARENVELSPIL